MRKFIALLTLVPLLALAQSKGHYNVAVSNIPYKVSLTRPGYVFVYNAGTNTAFVSYGGHVNATDYDSFLPIRAGAQYTTLEKYSFVSVICSSNGAATQVDIGMEVGP